MIFDFYEAGIDVESARERFVGNELIYTKHLYKFIFNDGLEKGKKCIEDKDVENAFSVFHQLKGLTGNLSLFRLHEKVCIVVEELRAGRLPSDLEVEAATLEFERAVESIDFIQKNEIKLW